MLRSRPGGACRQRWVLGSRGEADTGNRSQHPPPPATLGAAYPGGELACSTLQGLDCTPTTTPAVGRLADHAPPKEILHDPGDDSDMYPAMGCSSVFPGVGKTLEHPLARYGGGEARDRPGGGDGTSWCQSRPRSVPALARLSRELPRRNERYGGVAAAPGGYPEGSRPGQTSPGRTAPPRLPPAYSPRGLNSRQPRVLGRRVPGTMAGAGGERGVVLHPPDNASPGGRVRNGPESSSGAKIPPGRPSPFLPCPRCGARVPIWRAVAVEDVDATAVHLAPIPPLLVSGGAGGTRAKGA